MSDNCSEYKGALLEVPECHTAECDRQRAKLCSVFTGVSTARREAAAERREVFQASILEAGCVLAEFGPQALSSFQETTSSSITLAGVEAVLFKLVKPRLVTDQVLL